MRTLVRLVGLFFIVAALLVLGAELAMAGDGNGAGLTPLGAIWYRLHPGSLNLTQAVIERYIWEPLWDPVLAGLLQWPAAPTFGGLGVLLIALTFLRLPKSKTKAKDAGEDHTKERV